MDLVVLIDDPDAGLDPSLFVSMIGDLLERVSGNFWIEEWTNVADLQRRPTLTSSLCPRLVSPSSSST